jgi:hypothetical protein
MNKNIIENEIKTNILKDASDEEKVVVHYANFELIQEEHERMSSLAERIMNSMYNEVNEITLVTSLLDKEEIKLYEKEFFPIFSTELDTDILKILKKKFRKKYKTIFLDMPYEELKGLKTGCIKGKLTDESGNIYEIEFRLIKEEKYIKKIKEIYEVIKHNKIKWQNIYFPFAYKAYSLIIQEVSEELESRLSFLEKLNIEIDYPESIRKNVIDKILCLNMREELVNPDVFVRPTEEQLYFEHRIEKCEEDILVSKEVEKFEFLYKDTKTLRIITKSDKYERMRLYFINHVSEELKKKITLYGNMKNFDRISNRKRENVLILRNIDEINEVLRQYEVFEKIEVTGISDENSMIIPIYDLEIEDKNEFLLKNKKKNLYLKIEYEETEYLTDKLSFMKSVLEEYLVDCNCIFTK